LISSMAELILIKISIIILNDSETRPTLLSMATYKFN
jgi:hypothetical protein